MEFRKDESAGYLANHVARIFARGLAARVRSLGLTTGTFPALLELWEKDGLTQKQLVEKLDIEQATMANTLTRMERDGLIRRTKHPSDARAQQIWLTAGAKRIRDSAYDAANAVNARALSELSAQERDFFIDCMSRVIAAMQMPE